MEFDACSRSVPREKYLAKAENCMLSRMRTLEVKFFDLWRPGVYGKECCLGRWVMNFIYIHYMTCELGARIGLH